MKWSWSSKHSGHYAKPLTLLARIIQTPHFSNLSKKSRNACFCWPIDFCPIQILSNLIFNASSWYFVNTGTSMDNKKTPFFYYFLYPQSAKILPTIFYSPNAQRHGSPRHSSLYSFLLYTQNSWSSPLRRLLLLVTLLKRNSISMVTAKVIKVLDLVDSDNPVLAGKCLVERRKFWALGW